MTENPWTNPTTLCEGPCGSEVEVDETSSCEHCGLDPLCNNCIIADEHQCPGKPGKPGGLNMEVGQRVQDKYEQPKQAVGRIVAIDDEYVDLAWRQPSMKSTRVPRKAAEALLENSEMDW